MLMSVDVAMHLVSLCSNVAKLWLTSSKKQSSRTLAVLFSRQFLKGRDARCVLDHRNMVVWRSLRQLVSCTCAIRRRVAQVLSPIVEQASALLTVVMVMMKRWRV